MKNLRHWAAKIGGVLSLLAGGYVFLISLALSNSPDQPVLVRYGVAIVGGTLLACGIGLLSLNQKSTNHKPDDSAN